MKRVKKLARLVGQRRALLILDGVEPLQYGPTSPTPAPGELKDQGLSALLKSLAGNNQGLCIVTTRHSLPDLQAHRQGNAPEITLHRLPLAAGVELLKTLGVKGIAKEYETMVEDVKGHALTLTLLGSYLRDAHGGDIRRRDLIKFADANAEELGGHAFHVMDAYAAWLGNKDGKTPEEQSKGQQALAILRVLGLFDRPATADCLAALLNRRGITHLTKPLMAMSEPDLNLAYSRLDAAKLLTVRRDSAGSLLSLDAHPLLREYFGQQLRTKYAKAWKEGHRRLYAHLCETTPDKANATLEDLQPLYQAVAHGCQAGLWQEALNKVYHARIMRGTEDDGFYSTSKLGAYGSDLGAVACFFEQPWRRVSPALNEDVQAWLLGEAAFRLRALGRLAEARVPMRTELEMRIQQENWKNASISATNLSELELTLGDVEAAVRDAELAMSNAKHYSDAIERMLHRTTYADALHQAGHRGPALALFREAEAMQIQRQPEYPLLYSVQGFHYADLLLAEGERVAWAVFLQAAPPNPGPATCTPVAAVVPVEPRPSGSGGTSNVRHSHPGVVALLPTVSEVAVRVTMTLGWVTTQRWLVDIALDHLMLSRAALYEAIMAGTPLASPHASLEQAVDGLRRSGDLTYLPLGLLTRSWLRRLEGKATGPDSAQVDLEEAWEIAERGPMPLFLADIHLHRARLFGSLPGPYPWASVQDDLAEARRLIDKHGYGRRKDELADAERWLGAGPPA